MKQVELARVLGVSKAYVSMVIKGKKKPSKEIYEKLGILGINLGNGIFEAGKPILSHARLPVPTLLPPKAEYMLRVTQGSTI